MPETSKSLYARFREEIYPSTTVIESAAGFIEFQINGDQLYIINAYVIPEHRKTGELRWLHDRAVDVGRSKGCRSVLTSLDPKHENSDGALRAILAMGGRPLVVDQGLLFFIREL